MLGLKERQKTGCRASWIEKHKGETSRWSTWMACINHEVKIKKLEKHKGETSRAHGLYKSMRKAKGFSLLAEPF